MSRPELRLHPDPVLREVCAAVTEFDEALRDLVDDLLAVMYAEEGRGLAAPQIGVTRRIFAMDAGWKDGAPSPRIFVNPVIVWSAEEVAGEDEGCLSLPDTPCHVVRPVAIRLRWQEVGGATREEGFDGFAARCIQHEIDHLDGRLCLDYTAAA